MTDEWLEAQRQEEQENSTRQHEPEEEDDDDDALDVLRELEQSQDAPANRRKLLSSPS